LAVVPIIVVWFLVEGGTVFRTARWGKAFWIGAIGFGIGSVLFVTTQSLTDPVTTALAAATMPVAGVALEVVLDGRKLTGAFVTGVILVLLGGYLATGLNLQQAGFGLGAVLGLVSAALFAWGSRATVKSLPGMTPLGRSAVTSVGMMGFCVLALGVGIVFGTGGTTMPGFDGRSLALMLVYAWIALSVSQVLWISGVGSLGIGVASFHLNAAPFYVMLILVALGGSWSWQQVVGAAVLAAGVILSQRHAGFRQTVASTGQ